MRVSLLLSFSIAIALVFFSSLALAHAGEQKSLEYEIAYTDYYGLDENSVPQYVVGSTMFFEVRLKNVSSRTFKNLQVQAFQEYYTALGAFDGQAMPGSNSTVWQVESLKPEEEVILQGSYATSSEVLPGYDKTRLIIKHYNNGKGIGSEIIHNELAGVWCPPE